MGVSLRQRLLLSSTMLASTLTGYVGRAYAGATGGACTSPSTYQCSGSFTVPQTVTDDDAIVTVVSPGLRVITTGGTSGTALTITGNGALSFTDPYSYPASYLFGGGYDALSIRATGDSGNPGSITVNTSGRLIGTNGIDARNDGSGAIDITANGDLTGHGFSGVYAKNSGTTLTVTTRATVAGDARGIDARNYGNGAVDIKAYGDVTGTGFEGIYALNYGTNLSVTTGAGTTVTGSNSGIFANNHGSGTLEITANGDVGDASTVHYGISALNYGTNLTVTTSAGTTVTGSSSGIFAHNFGHGALTINANGAPGVFPSLGYVTGTNGYGIYGRNSASGTDLTVMIQPLTTITGGVYARNDGGGILTITSYIGAYITNTSGSGIYARNYDGAGLTVTTAGAPGTITGHSSGIHTVNGGGKLLIAASGNVVGTNGYGIYARNYGTDLIVGAYSVTGQSSGIYARNDGSGGLYVYGADVTGSTDYGINAQNGSAGTYLTVRTAAGYTVMGGQSGISAHNDGSGALSITANGNVTGTTQGINARNMGSGALTVTANGGVTGTGATSTGIRVQNGTSGTSAGTNLTVTTSTFGVSGGDTGIDARNYGNGFLKVTANGDVTGTTGHGILAENFANSTGDLSVSTGLGTKVMGTSAIVASNYGSGAVSITVNGIVDGQAGTGIFAHNAGTDLTITTAAGSNVSGASDGISAQTSAGTLKVTAEGDVTSTSSTGILANNNGGGPIDIAVGAASIVTSTGSGASEFAIAFTGGPGTLTLAGTLNGGAAGAVQFDQVTPLANRLELQPTAVINGNVFAGPGTNDTLAFGGSGYGTFDLTAIDTGAHTQQYRGFETFQVDSGTWSFSGATTAAFTVEGGTLKGTGTFGGLTVNGGTIAPGNSIGTMYVNGAFTLGGGAVYEVEANAQGQSDKVIVKGTVNLTGATLSVIAANGNYKPKTNYVIIDNDGTDAVKGKFGTVTNNLAFLTPSVVYNGGTGNDVVLTLARTSGGGGGGKRGGGGGGSGVLSFCSVANTRNQCNVAHALDLFPTGNQLFLDILNQTATGARQAFDTLSGEIHATVAGMLADDSRYVREAILGRLLQANYAGGNAQMASLAAAGPQVASLDSRAMALGYGDKSLAPPPRSPLAFWTHAFGAWANFDSDGNAATANRNLGGFVSGMDAAIGGSWRAGLATGASFSNVNVNARYSSAQVDSYHLGGYLGGIAGAFALRGGGTWTWSNIDTSRAMMFPGFYERQKAGYKADTGQLFGEAAYPMQLWGMGVEPFAGLAYVSVNTDNFHERGGSLSSLNGRSTDENVGYTTVGLRAAQTMTWGAMQVTPHLSAAWQHAFDDVTPDAALAFASTGIGFTVYGVPLAQDSALIDAGLDFALGPRTTAGVSYSGQIAHNVHDNAVKGRLTWLF